MKGCLSWHHFGQFLPLHVFASQRNGIECKAVTFSQFHYEWPVSLRMYSPLLKQISFSVEKKHLKALEMHLRYHVPTS